jgi:predicted nucleic acid-binding Zn ribbon protein
MESLSNTLLSLYRGTASHDPWVTACLEGAWSGLVGENVAKVSRPVWLKNAELAVEVSSEPWLSALESMKPEMLRRIRSFAGSDVKRLVLVRKQSS